MYPRRTVNIFTQRNHVKKACLVSDKLQLKNRNNWTSLRFTLYNKGFRET